MFEFYETIALEIPSVGSRFVSFEEAETKKGLIIEVAAIHEGITNNHTGYSAAELADSINTWVTPYAKPVIRNHDLNDEAIGRIIAAKMDKEEDGTPYSRLQIAITDPTAIEKVLDERYLTGSVGGKAGEALCSVCNADWSKASTFKLGCKHQRGKVYKVDGKDHVAHLKMGKLAFKEYSIVNAPADARSGVRSMSMDTTSTASESDGWVTSAARIFSINMDKEEIIEYTESEDRNILSTMKKKDASPLYLGIKGAYLSALAVQELEENDMEDEDILAVSEELSDHLSTSAIEAEEVDSAEEDSEEADKKHVFKKGSDDAGTCALCGEPMDSSNHVEKDDPTLDKDDDNDSESEEGQPNVEEGSLSNEPFATDDPRYSQNHVNRPQGQEKVHARDIGPETSSNAPIQRQSDDSNDGEAVSEQEDLEMELNEKIESLELRIEELNARESVISEENARLKVALKGSLAERVVDSKIMLGMIARDNREAELQEHLNRSASSLADSLRDLAQMKPTVLDYSGVPKVGNESVAIPVGKDKDGAREKVFTIGPEMEEGIKKLDPEEFFVEALMGRRKL